AKKLLDHADLVAYLRAPEQNDKRMSRLFQERSQDRYLALQQKAGHRRQLVRDALGGCMGTVCGAEGVVHEDVPETREPADELGIVPGLAGFEPAVLEHQHLPRTDLVTCSLDLVSHHVCRLANLSLDQLRQAAGDRGHRQLGLAILRTPEMRDQ